MLRHTNIFGISLSVNEIPVKPKWLKLIKTLKYEPYPVNNEIRNLDETGLTTLNRNILGISGLKDLKAVIMKNLEDVMYNQLGVKNNFKFFIQRSWVNRHPIKSGAPKHYHSNAVYSGVYYLQTPPQCGNLILHDPFENERVFKSTIGILFDKANESNSPTINFPQKEGTLIFFPAFLKHSVQQNLAADDRLSIAFDVWVKGQWSDGFMCYEIK
jgi:uncharacterized protein (TIGR02466 family)|tara:strand:+ start:333 stop:974 length:642 start_codon:yes stop_codon:yes gene_type:complete